MRHRRHHRRPSTSSGSASSTCPAAADVATRTCARRSKQSDGDPHMKAQRRSRAEAIATNRMLLDVPKADVVIVNPTHFAVALKWTRARGTAPVCVAKGEGEVALTHPRGGGDRRHPRPQRPAHRPRALRHGRGRPRDRARALPRRRRRHPLLRPHAPRRPRARPGMTPAALRQPGRPRRGAQGPRPRAARRRSCRGPPPRGRDRRPHAAPPRRDLAGGIALPPAQQALRPGLGRAAHPRRRPPQRAALAARIAAARAEAVQSLGKHRALENLVERAEPDRRQPRRRPRRARGSGRPKPGATGRPDVSESPRRSRRVAMPSSSVDQVSPGRHRLRVGERPRGDDLARRERRAPGIPRDLLDQEAAAPERAAQHVARPAPPPPTSPSRASVTVKPASRRRPARPVGARSRAAGRSSAPRAARRPPPTPAR